MIGNLIYLRVDDLTSSIHSYGKEINAALLHIVSGELVEVKRHFLKGKLIAVFMDLGTSLFRSGFAVVLIHH